MKLPSLVSVAVPILAGCSYAAPVENSPLLNLHKSLVEINSTTGSEGKAANFLKTYLEDRGFVVELQPVQGERKNVYAYLEGSRSNKVLVTSHIDTVPPFLPYERRGDEIWGRGSVDAKASIAAQIIAVESLLNSSQIEKGDVSLLYVVGEETSGDGMIAANDLDLKWESVIFGEPTELKLSRGHKGGVGFTLKAHGKAGHSGYPETGRNAIDILARAIVALDWLSLPWSDEFGNTTINVGTIDGGVARNVIPENATAGALARIASGTPKDIQKLVTKAIEGISSHIDVEFSEGVGPVATDFDIQDFETVVLNYGTDIPHLKGDHKKYLYGPGSILEAHSDHEHLKISDLTEAVEGYKKLITGSLKKASPEL